MWSQIAVSLQTGNAYITIILALGFLGCVIMFERFIMLQMVYYLDFSKFLSNFKKIVQAEDLDRAVNLCKSASYTSLPHIALKALEAAEADPSTVKGTIEEETIDFLPKLETRLGILPSVSTLILLVGVLGTIDGLWGAFDSIAVLDTSEKQSRLAHGIAGSLNPTSLALLMSMLFLASHQILKGIAIKLTERIHYGVTVLHNLLVPQEMATIMAPADMGAAPMPVNQVEEYAEPMTDSPAVEEADDSFDDASVEDIKDEEEII